MSRSAARRSAATGLPFAAQKSRLIATTTPQGLDCRCSVADARSAPMRKQTRFGERARPGRAPAALDGRFSTTAPQGKTGVRRVGSAERCRECRDAIDEHTRSYPMEHLRRVPERDRPPKRPYEGCLVPAVGADAGLRRWPVERRVIERPSRHRPPGVGCSASGSPRSVTRHSAARPGYGRSSPQHAGGRR